MLAALEVSVWQLRSPEVDQQSLPVSISASIVGDVMITEQQVEQSTAAGPKIDAVTSEHSGSQKPQAASPPLEQSTPFKEPVSWDELRRQVAGCQACELHLQRQQPVLGQGSPTADWLIVGGAPGSSDEQLGNSYSGRAGKLLADMMLALGLSLEQAYVTTIVKCRPNNDRAPAQSECEHCLVHLQHQVALVKPKIILVMGTSAAQAVLNRDQPLAELRGQDFVFGASAIPVVVTQDPVGLLTMAGEKAHVWDDLCFALRRYNGSLLLE